MSFQTPVQIPFVFYVRLGDLPIRASLRRHWRAAMARKHFP
jgi:hypothetical protein